VFFVARFPMQKRIDYQQDRHQHVKAYPPCPRRAANHASMLQERASIAPVKKIGAGRQKPEAGTCSVSADTEHRGQTSYTASPESERAMDTALAMVDVVITDKIGVITFNNSMKQNALSKGLIADLCAALEDLRMQGSRVVILRAPAGASVFSSGHDVRELPTNGRDPLTYNDPLRRVIRTIELFPAPVIAMVEGSVWGGACELVMSCDLIVAGDDSTFAITPAKWGVPYNISGVQNFLNTGGMPLCKEMLFTAQPVAAKRLVEQGIVSHAVPRDQLETVTQAIAQQIAQNSPLVISLLKEELRLLSASHHLSPETFERVQALRRQVYDSQDYREGIRAFLEKRSPEFRGK
jgi:methylmalonyl-CoA decarboxylase